MIYRLTFNRKSLLIDLINLANDHADKAKDFRTKMRFLIICETLSKPFKDLNKSFVKKRQSILKDLNEH